MVVFLILDVSSVQRVALFPCQTFVKFPSFHFMWWWEIHFSFFLFLATFALVINYGRQILGKKKMNIYVVLLFQRANCTIFFFFYFTGEVDQVMCLLKKKKKKREVCNDWVQNHSVNPGQYSNHIPGVCIRVHACSMSSRVTQLCIESWCCLQAVWPWSS